MVIIFRPIKAIYVLPSSSPTSKASKDPPFLGQFLPFIKLLTNKLIPLFLPFSSQIIFHYSIREELFILKKPCEVLKSFIHSFLYPIPIQCSGADYNREVTTRASLHPINQKQINCHICVLKQSICCKMFLNIKVFHYHIYTRPFLFPLFLFPKIISLCSVPIF